MASAANQADEVISVLASTDSNMELPRGLRNLLQNLHALVQIKLDNSNFVVWKMQLQTILRANNLLAYVDGSKRCPAAVRINAEGIEEDNPDHCQWKLVDEHLKSCLFASISPSLLVQERYQQCEDKAKLGPNLER